MSTSAAVAIPWDSIVDSNDRITPDAIAGPTGEPGGRKSCSPTDEAIEQSREKVDQAETGDSVGLQLAEITRREITSGDILTSPL
jgi:hypothetical protein